MDVWWVVHDGGILILIGYLLHTHAVWRGCKLRLFTVIKHSENVGKVSRELQGYLKALRIRAEVHVVSLDVKEMGDYVGDWTIRRRSKGKSKSVDSVFALGEREEVAEHLLAEEPKFQHLRRKTSAGLRGHHAIRRLVYTHSKDSELVLLNLPPPAIDTVDDPLSYFQLVGVVYMTEVFLAAAYYNTHYLISIVLDCSCRWIS